MGDTPTLQTVQDAKSMSDTQVRVSREIKQQLKKQAAAQDLNMRQLLDRICRDWLDRQATSA